MTRVREHVLDEKEPRMNELRNTDSWACPPGRVTRKL